MPHNLSALATEYQAALAAGDQPRALAIFRRIVEVVKSLTPAEMEGGLALLKKLFAAFFPPAAAGSANELAVAFTAEEVESLGIVDNAQTAIQLITLLFQIIRRLRAE